MAYGELSLPPERPTRNLLNGQFLKGHEPYQKGKKWDEWMSKEGQERSKKGWENLVRARGRKRSGYCGRPKRKVVAIGCDGHWTVYDSVSEAGERMGIIKENISRCCRQNQSRRKNLKTGLVNTDHKYMGFRFYYEDDLIWMQKIKKREWL